MNTNLIEPALKDREYSSNPIQAKPPSQDKEEELWKVSKGFESILMQYMMRSMRNTIHHSEMTEPSQGRKLFTEMLDTEYAKSTAGRSKGGLAEMIYKYLKAQKATSVPRLPTVPMDFDLHHPTVQPQVFPKGKSSPLSDSQLDATIRDASATYGVDSDLIKSVIRQESGNQVRAVSPAGAKGLMQLMDTTAREMGVRDVFNPRENIFGGVRYLSELLTRYKGDETLALAAYNAGPSNVAQYNGVPPFPETQNYVQSVLAIKARLKQLKQGGFDVIEDQ